MSDIILLVGVAGMGLGAVMLVVSVLADMWFGKDIDVLVKAGFFFMLVGALLVLVMFPFLVIADYKS